MSEESKVKKQKKEPEVEAANSEQVSLVLANLCSSGLSLTEAKKTLGIE